VAVQFSLSYDANGDPVLVENTVTGTRKVVAGTTPVVGEFKPRFEKPDDSTDSDDGDTTEKGSDIYRYINEMENNADNDLNLSFVDKQNLGAYTPEAIEAKGKPKTRTQEVMETIALAMIPYGNAAKTVVKALAKILPEESEEIKSIKQFYATPEMTSLVDNIPGMSNYNLVYGNPLNPSYGLSGAATKRTNTIAGTLANKYGMTVKEIEQAKLGLYTGPVKTDLITRIKNTHDLSKADDIAKDQFDSKKSQDIQDPNKDLVEGRFDGVGTQDGGRNFTNDDNSFRNQQKRESDRQEQISRERQEAAAAANKAATERAAREMRERGGGGDRDGGGGQGGNEGGQSGGQSSGSGYNEGNFCFDPKTLIQMANGSTKKIKDIQLGDATKGGEVTGVFQFKATDEIHDYKGVTVAGSHYVKEDGRFIMVKDSPLSTKINKIPVVYSLDTTGRRIFIKDIEFADYNGDGIAKGFLANAGVDTKGFDKEVLRQVENRLI